MDQGKVVHWGPFRTAPWHSGRRRISNILDHRGWDPASLMYPLAYLGLARAALLDGDVTKARIAYQDFFAIWRDADPDIPILIEAKKEYEKLR